MLNLAAEVPCNSCHLTASGDWYSYICLENLITKLCCFVVEIGVVLNEAEYFVPEYKHLYGG
jgi:hypothetical protein